MSESATTPTIITTDRQFCTFLIGDQLFGLDILDVREIVDQQQVSPVAHAPASVMGYVNIRGSIHLVLCLRHLLGTSGEAPTRRRLVVLKSRVIESCALMIDKVGDIVAVPADRIEPVRGGMVADPALVAGVCHLDGHLLVVLDPRRIAALMGI